MQYLKLDEYLKIARKMLKKYHPSSVKDEDAISYVAYWGMKADEQFDENKNDNRNGYRALYFMYGVKKWKRIMAIRQRNNKGIYSLNPTELEAFSTIKSGKSIQIEDKKQKNPSFYVQESELKNQILKSENLTEREKDILVMYCFDGYILDDIAKKYGISKQRISSLLNKSRDKMKEKLLNV